MNKIKEYFKGAKKEFKAIKWPTIAETRQLTIVVLGLSVFFAIFLGVFDYAFTYILGLII